MTEPTAEPPIKAEWYEQNHKDAANAVLGEYCTGRRMDAVDVDVMATAVAWLLADRDAQHARALAAAVTAEREKYLRVADYFDRQANTARDLSEQHWQDGEGPVKGANMTGQHLAYVDAARRIREVSS